MPLHREFVGCEFDALHVMHLHAFGQDAEASIASIGIRRIKRRCSRDCGVVRPSRLLLVVIDLLLRGWTFLKHLVIFLPATLCPTARARTDLCSLRNA